MTRGDLNVAIAAIIMTLAEVDDHTAPEGLCFLALQTVNAETYTLDAYTRTVNLLVQSNLVTRGYDMLVITPGGLAIAEAIEKKLLAKAAAAGQS